MNATPICTIHKAGCFIEGFDSILYNPQLRASNLGRFLAELFYGFIYDSKIVLAEPMVFDNQVMIRLLRKMQDQKLRALYESVRYVRFREPRETLESTFLNPSYVCSALSPEVEEERVLFLKSPANLNDSPTRTPDELLRTLHSISSLSDDDRSVLESFQRGLNHDWPWSHTVQGNTNHGYRMADRLGDWLDNDHERNGNQLREKITSALRQSEVYPTGKGPGLAFDVYFRGRSLWHQTKAAWLELLGADLFGRADEYVNSAYMEAIKRTCQAAAFVQTPLSFSDKENLAAQSVMNASIPNGVPAFEFRLNILTSPQQIDDNAHAARLGAAEDGLLESLNALYEDPDFLSAKEQLIAFNTTDPDYTKMYVDCFGRLATIANQAGGPFQLLLEGTRVVNVITKLSRCERETAREQDFSEANGCEQQDRF